MRFAWVKAHSGIDSNEKAYLLSKAATEKIDSTHQVITAETDVQQKREEDPFCECRHIRSHTTMQVCNRWQGKDFGGDTAPPTVVQDSCQMFTDTII